MPISGISQINLFGGEDPILDDWEVKLKELLEEPRKIVDVNIKLSVPHSIDEDTMVSWIEDEFGIAIVDTNDVTLRALSHIALDIRNIYQNYVGLF